MNQNHREIRHRCEFVWEEVARFVDQTEKFCDSVHNLVYATNNFVFYDEFGRKSCMRGERESECVCESERESESERERVRERERERVRESERE